MSQDKIKPDWLCKHYPDGTSVYWNPTVISREDLKWLGGSTKEEILRFMQYSVNPKHFQILGPGAEPAQTNNPRDTQVGGDHYKNLSVEPWAAMESWLSREEYIGYLRGNIIKYHARANTGKEDKEIQMRKAKHYADELESFLSRSKPAPVSAT